MRPTTDADAEWSVLTSDAGLALLAEVSEVNRPGPADLARWRRTSTAGHVAAALRLAETRRRGVAKFTRAAAMWFEPTGLEQATSEAVARHKACRFADNLVVDLCAGIGGDTIALGESGRVLAVDADAGMSRRCAWNAEVYGLADRVAAIQGRAETFPVPAGALVHIDPDRRARSARKALALGDYAPGVDVLKAFIRTARGGAIKLGPASDFEAYFAGPDREIELISLGRECKEATLWFGSLASCRRRATVLPAGATWTDRDGPDGVPPPLPISSRVFEPDPALIRSGLLDRFASAHGLRRIGDGVDLLTGPNPLLSPFLAAFEVIDVLPIDLKRIGREVSTRRLGPLEIKVRGLDLRPEAVRARLRPEGSLPASLLLVGGAGRRPGQAILARREPTAVIPDP